ncbi:winged helix-turn-helix domain-containing protein [Caulobacter segnis]|uniref:winged helix-turn-helix domain-containing protein n=1 Tax=Caulobacter segnis TaxID=88688 RepID=UPI00240EF71C|nr:winged helix-turn-helix domain-containing protein [Caulobacter segnis]MDG2522515.1 winged helix-turn-helix domain-containing protein [Caulobacter segnis]
MNELISPFRRLGRITLAVEPPFRLGVFEVRPAALEISGPQGEETLEPRVMQVLVALAKARGEPVGRDEMIDLCWDGRIVSEDALNRCVARLRKALCADPRVALETIPKIGYRLKVREGAPPEPEAAAKPQAILRGRRPSKRALLVGAAVLLFAAAGGASWFLNRPGPARTAQGFRPLTSEPGIESYPALSPSGDVLAYAAAARTHAPRDLYMRATRDGEPVRLTDNPLDDFAPAWSWRGDRIAFVRSDGQGACQILVMSIPGGAERVVGRCAGDSYTRVSWVDEKTLVYADRPSAGGPRRIMSLNLDTGAATSLTNPSPGLIGDSDPLLSPDCRLLVFRRSSAAGVDDLFVRDMHTGRERQLTNDGWKAHGFAWTHDNRYVVFGSNRGGDFGLWSVDAKRPAPPRRVSVGLLGLGRLSSDDEDRLAVEMNSDRLNLEKVGADGALTKLTANTGVEWDPAVAPDGAMAFVSDRSGASELWVGPSGGRVTRLTSLGASYVHGPHWSRDGRRVAFVAAIQRKVDIHEIGRDGSGLRALTQDGRDKASPVWARDGALHYVERSAQGWRLMRLGADGQARPVPGGEGWRLVRTDPEGRLYGVRTGDARLWTLPEGGGAPREAAPGLRLEDDAWAVGRDGVKYVRDRLTDHSSLWLAPWTGATRQFASLPGMSWMTSLAVDPRDDGVVYGRVIEDETDIGLLELSR